MSNLTLDASAALDPRFQLQQLLEQQALIQEQEAAILAQRQSIQAQIDSLAAGTPPQLHHRSSIKKQHAHHRGRDVPRSMSTQGSISMSRHVSSERAEAAAISRSLSQRSSNSMTRTSSKGSSTHRTGKIPFASKSNTPVRPLKLPSHNAQEMSAVPDWNNQEQSYGVYGSNQQAHLPQRSLSQHQSGLQQVPEHGRILEDLQDPGEYLARQFGTPILALSPAVPLPSSTFPPSHQNSVASFDFAMPTTPSTTNLTHATTIDNNTMSRSTSLFNDSFEMLRINSTASFSDLSPVDHSYDQTMPSPLQHPHCSSNEDQAQLLAGTGGVIDGSSFSHSLPNFTDPGSFGSNMEKSASNESVSSSSSSRNRLRLKLQNLHAASREIKPKGDVENATQKKYSSYPGLGLASKHGSQDKLPISKPSYQRPKHDRVFCSQCENHPEGFRGEHELRRHQDREHKQLVTKWIAVEPKGEGHVQPIVPLSKCKLCSQVRKTYGAYYNVAAHLRRAHFKPKSSKSRNKGKKEPEEKRGGKGGGDWPPMSELKHWMKQVEVPGSETTDTSTHQADALMPEDELDTANEHQHVQILNDDYSAGYYDATTSTSCQAHVSGNFDSSLLDLQSPFMPQVMYGDSSKGSFSSFTQTFQSDPLALYDDSQYLNDSASLTGSNLVHFSF